MNLANLQKLMTLGLSTEQMAGVIEVLTEELAPIEAMRRKASARQLRYRQRDSNVTVGRDSDGEVTSPRATDIDIYNTTNLSNTLDSNKKLSLSLSQPLRANGTNPRELGTNPRAMGVNPRALGTNPRALAEEPVGFQEFWSAYPRRDGSMDRKGALKAFGAAVKRASITTIIEGVQHFAEAMKARGKVGSEFIPQPRTWLNGDRWNERYDAAAPADGNEAQWLAIIQKHSTPTGS